MVQAATITFLKQLAKNNNKAWFDTHRKEYETAKTDFENIIGSLLQKMATSIDPAFADQKAKDCIFRIYRDVRFSKDKTPYKAHFSAAFSRSGKKDMTAGYYLHLEPGKAFAGGGIWMPENEHLKKIRQEIDYNFEDFKKIINNAAFKKMFNKLEGEQLKKAPVGYTEDNPALDYLKMKSYIVSHKLDDAQLSDKGFIAQCNKVFSTMKPLVDFINNALD
ncbi:MAG: DUF2461 domain-containing protein [Flavipsychrobacter sp.]